jgi:hypothetical protein
VLHAFTASSDELNILLTFMRQVLGVRNQRRAPFFIQAKMTSGAAFVALKAKKYTDK